MILPSGGVAAACCLRHSFRMAGVSFTETKLLAKIFVDYGHGKRFRAPRQHTVAVVMAILTRMPRIGVPLGFDPPDQTKAPAGIFVGYLMLDALTGNQDRHHENWGLILSSDNRITLAPTFDHAASLGRNEMDEERIVRLTTRDRGRSVEKYVERAKSAFYETPASEKPLSTLAAFQEAAKLSPEARHHWLQQLAATSLAEFQAIFDNIPPAEMTEPARVFAMKMLEINRSRLLQILAD